MIPLQHFMTIFDVNIVLPFIPSRNIYASQNAGLFSFCMLVLECTCYFRFPTFTLVYTLVFFLWLRVVLVWWFDE